MEVGRISPEFFDFEFSPRGEHGEGGQGFASVNAILPGRRSGRHIFGPRHCGIPQEDLPRAGPSDLSALTPPFGSRLLMPLRVFHQAPLFLWNNWILGSGSDFSLLRMASRRSEEVQSERCFEISVIYFSLHVQFAALRTNPKTTTFSDPSYTHHHTHTHTPGVCVTRLFISQLNDFSWFCHFMFGNCYCGFCCFFFFSCGLFN